MFGLSAAPFFEKIIGVEVSELSVEAAKKNAAQNKINNAEFLCGSSELIFDKVKHLDNEECVVVIDPPRKGAIDS